MNPVYIIGGLVALLFLLPKKAAPQQIVVTNGPGNGDKDYNPGATQSVSVWEQTFSALDKVFGDDDNGAEPTTGGAAPIDCGLKPKVPANWAKLPKNSPVRLKRVAWENCMGNVYVGGKLVKK